MLILDESQTVLGRTGKMFGFDYEEVMPDIITLSKTLGGGLPLSAVITTDKLAQMAKGNGFSHYTSYASDPFTATAELAVVQMILDEGLVERSARIGQLLKDKLCELQKHQNAIGDVRGHGLILGVKLWPIVKPENRAMI